jgi:hypothetical protein
VSLLSLLFLAFLLGNGSDRYLSAVINVDGSVTVTTEDGRDITPTRLAPYAKDIENVGASRAAVSSDHESVGWLALFENCCTSYPLPLKLVILHGGRLKSYEGNAAIWFWSFQNGGTRVAAREEMPHGGQGLHYDLWDVASGKRVAEYTPEYDQDGRTVARPNEPEWVKALDVAEAESRRP